MTQLRVRNNTSDPALPWVGSTISIENTQYSSCFVKRSPSHRFAKSCSSQHFAKSYLTHRYTSCLVHRRPPTSDRHVANRLRLGVCAFRLYLGIRWLFLSPRHKAGTNRVFSDLPHRRLPTLSVQFHWIR